MRASDNSFFKIPDSFWGWTSSASVSSEFDESERINGDVGWPLWLLVAWMRAHKRVNASDLSYVIIDDTPCGRDLLVWSLARSLAWASDTSTPEGLGLWLCNAGIESDKASPSFKLTLAFSGNNWLSTPSSVRESFDLTLPLIWFSVVSTPKPVANKSFCSFDTGPTKVLPPRYDARNKSARLFVAKLLCSLDPFTSVSVSSDIVESSPIAFSPSVKICSPINCSPILSSWMIEPASGRSPTIDCSTNCSPAANSSINASSMVYCSCNCSAAVDSSSNLPAFNSSMSSSSAVDTSVGCMSAMISSFFSSPITCSSADSRASLSSIEPALESVASTSEPAPSLSTIVSSISSISCLTFLE